MSSPAALPTQGDGEPTSMGRRHHLAHRHRYLNSEGKVYVADEALDRISIYSGHDGDFLRGSGNVSGSGEGQWDKPSGLAFDQRRQSYSWSTAATTGSRS